MALLKLSRLSKNTIIGNIHKWHHSNLTHNWSHLLCLSQKWLFYHHLYTYYYKSGQPLPSVEWHHLLMIPWDLSKKLNSKPPAIKTLNNNPSMGMILDSLGSWLEMGWGLSQQQNAWGLCSSKGHLDLKDSARAWSFEPSPSLHHYVGCVKVPWCNWWLLSL